MKDGIAMDRHGIRYMFEHKLLPQWFFKEKYQFIIALLQKKDFLYNIISDIFDKEKVENSYTDDMFEVLPSKIADEVMMIKISFPEPEEEPLCYCSYLFFDKEFEKISYFCIEKGDAMGKERQFVCAWNADGSHNNYGSCTLEKDNDLLRCADIHMKKEYGLTRKTEE